MWFFKKSGNVPTKAFSAMALEAFNTDKVFKVGHIVFNLSKADICVLETESRTILTKKVTPSEITTKLQNKETIGRFYLEASRIYGKKADEYQNNTANAEYRAAVDKFLLNATGNQQIVDFIKIFVNQDSNLLNSGMETLILFLNTACALYPHFERKINIRKISETKWQIQDYSETKTFTIMPNPNDAIQTVNSINHKNEENITQTSAPLDGQSSMVVNNIYTIMLDAYNNIKIDQQFDVHLNATTDQQVLKKILNKAKNFSVELTNKKISNLKNAVLSLIIQLVDEKIHKNESNEMIKNFITPIYELPMEFINTMHLLTQNDDALEDLEVFISNGNWKDTVIFLINFILSTNTSVKKFKINGSDLAFHDVIILLNFLKKNTTLEILDLSTINLETKNIKALAQLINESNCTKIILNNSKISNKNKNEFCEWITGKSTVFVETEAEAKEIIKPESVANDSKFNLTSTR